MGMRLPLREHDSDLWRQPSEHGRGPFLWLLASASHGNPEYHPRDEEYSGVALLALCLSAHLEPER